MGGWCLECRQRTMGWAASEKLSKGRTGIYLADNGRQSNGFIQGSNLIRFTFLKHHSGYSVQSELEGSMNRSRKTSQKGCGIREMAYTRVEEMRRPRCQWNPERSLEGRMNNTCYWLAVRDGGCGEGRVIFGVWVGQLVRQESLSSLGAWALLSWVLLYSQSSAPEQRYSMSICWINKGVTLGGKMMGSVSDMENFDCLGVSFWKLTLRIV